MIYPGHDIARQISGPPVLFDTIVDEDIPTGVVPYDIVWTDAYAAVFIELTRVQSNGDGQQMYMLMSSDGGATFAQDASAYWHRVNSHGAGVATAVGSPGTVIGMTTLGGIGSAAGETGDYSIILPSPSVSGRKSAIIWGGHIRADGNPYSDMSYGHRNADVAIDAVRFQSGGGSLWTSGHARAFGLRRP